MSAVIVLTAALLDQLRPKFHARIEKQAGGCWLWTGRVMTTGYGSLIFGRRPNRQEVVAHRVSYALFRGPLNPATGLVLDHVCRNRRCVNPQHLELVTSKENTRRGLNFTAENARKTHCHRGHPLSGSNLSTYMDNGAPMRVCVTCRRDNERRRTRLRRQASHVIQPEIGNRPKGATR